MLKDLLAGEPFAPCKLGVAILDGLAHLVKARLVQRIAFFQEAQAFTDHLTGGLVQPALDLLGYELFEFRGERHVHGYLAPSLCWFCPCFLSLTPVYHNNEKE